MNHGRGSLLGARDARMESPAEYLIMMIRRLRLWFRDPLFLLALAAGLIAFVVQAGELGSSDTQHRLQSTHALWTSQPPVFPEEYPEFGVHGRGGRLQSGYGIGQSLLMLPQDIVATYVEKLPVFAGYSSDDRSVRVIIVSYFTNILIAMLTALVCFRFLRQFGFGVGQAAAGVSPCCSPPRICITRRT